MTGKYFSEKSVRETGYFIKDGMLELRFSQSPTFYGSHERRCFML